MLCSLQYCEILVKFGDIFYGYTAYTVGNANVVYRPCKNVQIVTKIILPVTPRVELALNEHEWTWYPTRYSNTKFAPNSGRKFRANSTRKGMGKDVVNKLHNKIFSYRYRIIKMGFYPLPELFNRLILYHQTWYVCWK